MTAAVSEQAPWPVSKLVLPLMTWASVRIWHLMRGDRASISRQWDLCSGILLARYEKFIQQSCLLVARGNRSIYIVVQEELVDGKQLMKKRNWLYVLWQQKRKKRARGEKKHLWMKRVFHLVVFPWTDCISFYLSRLGQEDCSLWKSVFSDSITNRFRNVIWTALYCSMNVERHPAWCEYSRCTLLYRNLDPSHILMKTSSPVSHCLSVSVGFVANTRTKWDECGISF